MNSVLSLAFGSILLLLHQKAKYNTLVASAWPGNGHKTSQKIDAGHNHGGDCRKNKEWLQFEMTFNRFVVDALR
ncbi:hypothetical protein [Synechococcus sp. M16CYN]|uniref:hypothetical protein n=1 Tax=Synechococcus sp. M16CYN TaxID=3103139 RepID=UPI003342A2A3